MAVQYSGDLSIDGLLYSSFNWNMTSDTVLYFEFTSTDLSATWWAETQMSATAQSAVWSVLTEISSITGISFVYTTDTSLADLHFSVSELGAWAGMETTIWSNSTTADAYVTLDYDYSQPVKGNYAYQTLLHETGHAMGLDHSFDGAYAVPASEESWDYTVMSYTRGGTGYQSSYQENDVAALQWLYGADGLGGASYAKAFTAYEKTVLYVADAVTGGTLDETTFQAYTDWLDSGASEATIAGYMASASGLNIADRAGFLDAIFNNALGRSPTSEESAAYRTYGHDSTPGEVISWIAGSDEHVSLMAGVVTSLQSDGYGLIA